MGINLYRLSLDLFISVDNLMLQYTVFVFCIGKYSFATMFMLSLCLLYLALVPRLASGRHITYVHMSGPDNTIYMNPCII